VWSPPGFNPWALVVLALYYSSVKLSFRIFADDTNIFFTGNNPKEVEFTMNEEIKLVLKYCAINKLSVKLIIC